ncbi:retinol dehydrogenase 8-like [Xenia sp. Carnegie-2017]|uniref:retinol dehydrogenase 8-like n=1 Tax=Xenia sp. Carnegie-2017 TaxID=2897299 RepID=UPI001F03344F|nr:retinol dehydrogenase 8-like [Xenia sp. Carnegie-2017]
MAQRNVVITGCSSGIGLDTAVFLAKNESKKYKVYACMRNLAKKGPLVEKAGDSLDKTLFILEMDVKSETSVNKAIKHVLDVDGRVDVLINNAGIGLMGALEHQSMETIRNIYETNYTGVVHGIRAVLPSMKKRKSGRIITVSSVGGLIGMPMNAVYCSTKFAVWGLSEALAPELNEYNINISLIEPGPVVTEFLNAVDSKGFGGAQEGDDITKSLIDKLGQMFKAIAAVSQSGEDIAKYILQAMEDESPHFHYITNESYVEMAKKKFIDVTGDKIANSSFDDFFSGK